MDNQQEPTEEQIKGWIEDIIIIKSYIEYLKLHKPNTLLEYNGIFISLEQFDKLFNNIGKLDMEPWIKFVDMTTQMIFTDIGYIEHLKKGALA